MDSTVAGKLQISFERPWLGKGLRCVLLLDTDRVARLMVFFYPTNEGTSRRRVPPKPVLTLLHSYTLSESTVVDGAKANVPQLGNETSHPMWTFSLTSFVA